MPKPSRKSMDDSTDDSAANRFTDREQRYQKLRGKSAATSSQSAASMQSVKKITKPSDKTPEKIKQQKEVLNGVGIMDETPYMGDLNNGKKEDIMDMDIAAAEKAATAAEIAEGQNKFEGGKSGLKDDTLEDNKGAEVEEVESSEEEDQGNDGKTNRRLSFAPDAKEGTETPAVKKPMRGWIPGSLSSSKSTLPKALKSALGKRKPQKRIVPQHNTFVTFRTIISQQPADNDLQKAFVETISNGLTSLQNVDKEACILKPDGSDGVAGVIWSSNQFPPSDVFLSSWLDMDNKEDYLFEAKISKDRWYVGTMLLATEWEPNKLFAECKYKLQKYRVRLEVKSLQVLQHDNNMIITGGPVGTSDYGAQSLVTLALRMGAQHLGESEDPLGDNVVHVYDDLPLFSATVNYVDRFKTPVFDNRKQKGVSSWQKKVIIITVSKEDAPEMNERLSYCNKNRILKALLGDFSRYRRLSDNPSDQEKKDTGLLIAASGAVNLSIGKVDLRHLENPDTPFTLHVTSKSGVETTTTKTARELLMVVKVDGIRLLQSISESAPGHFTAFYSGGKDCTRHKSKALELGDNAAGVLKFWAAGKGIDEEDMMNLIAGSFSPLGTTTAEGSKMTSDGRVINKDTNAVLDVAAAVRAAGIDISKGLSKEEREYYGLDAGDAVPNVPLVGPGSRAAYNFGDEDRTVVGDKDQPINKASGDRSIAESTQFHLPEDSSCYTKAPADSKPKSTKKAADDNFFDDGVFDIESDEEDENPGVHVEFSTNENQEVEVLSETGVSGLEREEGESNAAFIARQTKWLMDKVARMEDVLESDRNHYNEMRKQLESKNAELQKALKTPADAACDEHVDPEEVDTGNLASDASNSAKNGQEVGGQSGHGAG